MTEYFLRKSKSIRIVYFIASRSNVSEKIARIQRNKHWPSSIMPFPPTRTDQSGIKTRFQQCFDNMELPYSFALHQHFKLFWLTWLEENEFGFDLVVAKKEIKTKVVSLVDENETKPYLSKPSSSNSTLDSPNSNEAEFFETVYSIYLSEKECN